MLLRPKGIPEVYWVAGGAILLVGVRSIPPGLAAKAVAQGADVYLFLIGMMLLSELAREHGVFDWISSLAVRRARGSCARLFALVYVIGTVVTIFMSNDATAVVLTPAILAAVQKAKVNPLPHLFVCVLVANAASFVLPISNPANLVVFHQGMPPLGHWLLSFALPSLLAIAVTYLVLRHLFRKDLKAGITQPAAAAALNAQGKLVLVGLGVMVLVLLTASQLRKDLGLPCCLAALAITAVVSIKARSNPLQLMRELSWRTIVLVGGLFVMVAAVQSIGALRVTGAWLSWAQKLPPLLGVTITGLAVAVTNNLINNLPLGMIAGGTISTVHTTGMMINSVLVGVDLGPNLSTTGSLATILWLLAIRKEKLDVSFWDFLKIGVIAMPAAMVCALGGIMLSHVVFPSH